MNVSNPGRAVGDSGEIYFGATRPQTFSVYDVSQTERKTLLLNKGIG